MKRSDQCKDIYVINTRDGSTAGAEAVLWAPPLSTLEVRSGESKGQENPEFSASGTCGSFPYNPAVGSGTSGNGPVGPEILSFYVKVSHKIKRKKQ